MLDSQKPAGGFYMETIYFEKISELKKNKKELEKKLNIVITIKGKTATIQGSPFNEYEASLILDAISLGFSAKKALQLADEQFIFRKLPVKNFTKRKNLHEVRARIIGKQGKTKRTIEEISGCNIIIKDNTIGLIGPSESIETATTALTNLIRGSKQANVYRYLERMNAERKKYH